MSQRSTGLCTCCNPANAIPGSYLTTAVLAYLIICHKKEPITRLYSCTLGRAEEISKEEKKNQAK